MSNSTRIVVHLTSVRNCRDTRYTVHDYHTHIRRQYRLKTQHRCNVALTNLRMIVVCSRSDMYLYMLSMLAAPEMRRDADDDDDDDGSRRLSDAVRLVDGGVSFQYRLDCVQASSSLLRAGIIRNERPSQSRAHMQFERARSIVMQIAHTSAQPIALHAVLVKSIHTAHTNISHTRYECEPVLLRMHQRTVFIGGFAVRNALAKLSSTSAVRTRFCGNFCLFSPNYDERTFNCSRDRQSSTQTHTLRVSGSRCAISNSCALTMRTPKTV